MEFMSVDANRKELGKITSIKSADIEIGDTNTFELTFSVSDWEASEELNKMDYFSAEGEEIGGMVRKLKVMTEKGQVKASGYTWRGYLSKKIIEPPAGQTHKTVSGDANTIIKELVDPSFDGRIRASKSLSGLTLTNYQFDRYCTLLDGIQKMLATVKAKIAIRYVGSYYNKDGILERGYAEVSAVPAFDYSEKVEFSKDGRIHITATDDRTGVNHLVCLGKGEGTARTVLHLYVGADGTVGDTQYYTGIEEIAETYDYSSVESVDELRSQGIKRLNENKNSQSIEISPNDIEVGIGDVVGGREEITGIAMKTEVVRIIYKISSDGALTKQYKVGK